MSKIIAFSGGCFAGKTTCMEYIKDHLPNVKLISEHIREIWSGSIEDLRADANKYLEVQEDIMNTRFRNHFNAVYDVSDTIYIEDRSIADTLFYLTNFVDTKKLDSAHIEKYYELVEESITLCKLFKYDSVLIFEPLTGIKNTDPMRPSGVEESNKWEYDCIRALDKKFWNNCIDVNVLKHSYDEIISKII